MKKILPAIILALFLVPTYAQNNPLSLRHGSVFCELVDSSVTYKTKTQLYNDAKLWLVRYFKDLKQVVQIDHREDGLIAGTSSFPVIIVSGWGLDSHNRCYFTFTITVKEGKYRVQLFDFMVTTGPENEKEEPLENMYKKPDDRQNKQYISKVAKSVQSFLDSIQNAMQESKDDF